MKLFLKFPLSKSFLSSLRRASASNLLVKAQFRSFFPNQHSIKQLPSNRHQLTSSAATLPVTPIQSKLNPKPKKSASLSSMVIGFLSGVVFASWSAGNLIPMTGDVNSWNRQLILQEQGSKAIQRVLNELNRVEGSVDVLIDQKLKLLNSLETQVSLLLERQKSLVDREEIDQLKRSLVSDMVIS